MNLNEFANDNWHLLSQAEKLIVEWQYGMLGDFRTALFDAITRADESNLDRLALGFHDEVAGYRAWAHGTPYKMAEKLREMGLDI